jgi:hypothetical protein
MAIGSGSLSRAGQTLVGALSAMTVVGMVAASAPRIVDYMNRRNQTLRARNAMAAVEVEIRVALNDPLLYNGCPGACVLVPARLPERLRADPALPPARAVLGAQCPAASPGCGVRVRSLAVVGSRVDVQLVYEGTESSLKPESFSVVIPAHASNVVACAAGAPGQKGLDAPSPVFLGLDAAGNARCRPLSPTCGAGQFVQDYSPSTLATTCASFPNAPRGCSGLDKYLVDVSWSNNLVLQFDPVTNCRDRKTN